MWNYQILQQICRATNQAKFHHRILAFLLVVCFSLCNIIFKSINIIDIFPMKLRSHIPLLLLHVASNSSPINIITTRQSLQISPANSWTQVLIQWACALAQTKQANSNFSKMGGCRVFLNARSTNLHNLNITCCLTRNPEFGASKLLLPWRDLREDLD